MSLAMKPCRKFVVTSNSSEEEVKKYEEVLSTVQERCQKVFRTVVYLDHTGRSYMAFTVFRGNGKYYIVKELVRSQADFSEMIVVTRSREDVFEELKLFFGAEPRVQLDVNRYMEELNRNLDVERTENP